MLEERTHLLTASPNQEIRAADAGQTVLGPFTLNLRRTPEPNPFSTGKTAAVVLPLICQKEPSVLFIHRSMLLREHQGEIAFPGGRPDRTDADLTETALREFREEMGFRLQNRHIAGYLPWSRTRTGYAVLPVVVILPEIFHLNPNKDEVAEILNVPLDVLVWQFNRLPDVNPPLYRFFYFTGRIIWGATARIMVNFLIHCRL